MSRQPTFTHSPKPYGRRITLTLDAHALVVEDGFETKRLPLAEIDEVRLTFKPNNSFMRGFICRLTTREGRRLSFSNLSWRSLVASENLAWPYVRFVTALTLAIAAHNPGCRFLAGRPKAIWFAATLLAAALVLGLGVMIAMLARDAKVQQAIIIAVISLLMGWTLVDMVTRNRPRPFTPGAPPADLLPKVAEERRGSTDEG